MERKNIVWMDGTVEDTVPGKLLSDNPNFFGDCILTGVTYTYSEQPTGKADSEEDIPDFRGKRLIDGDSVCYFGKPVVETDKGIITVVFDFKSEYVFTELDALMRSDLSAADIEISSNGVDFQKIHSNTFSEKLRLYRMKLPQNAKGRYLRLTLTQPEMLRVIQIWVWGDCDSDSDINVAYEKNRFAIANSVSLQSLMGITNTAYSDVRGFYWSEKIKKATNNAAVVWSECDLHKSIAAEPILPEPDDVNKKIIRRVFKNGIETVCLALSNTSSTDSVSVTVDVNNSTSLRTELFAFGNVETRWYGVVPGPMLNKEHSIARPLMFKYLKNAPVIADFPTINLPAGGSCQLWLKIYGNDAEAGLHSITLSAGEATIEIETQVLPIALETPEHICLTYRFKTLMYPFVWEDRMKKEVEYRSEIGANMYDCPPTKGSISEEAWKTDPTTKFLNVTAFGKYHDLLYCNGITPEAMGSEEHLKNLSECVEQQIKVYKDLGVDTDCWYASLPDEPHAGNSPAIGVMVTYLKQHYPLLRIYCNPAFWIGYERGAVADDENLCKSLKVWYPNIDFSMPLMNLLRDRPRAYNFFSLNRPFNGQYQVSGQHMRADKPELFGLARELVWESLARDMNAWGFFAYYDEGSLDGWDETVQKDSNIYGTITYKCVYSGEFGPVPTRASEYLRDGWQDFRIMDLLSKKNSELATKIKQEFLDGCRDYSKLINKAIDALI